MMERGGSKYSGEPPLNAAAVWYLSLVFTLSFMLPRLHAPMLPLAAMKMLFHS